MVMAAAVPLRPDFDAAALRTLATQSRDPDQTRRLLALATIYEGQPRSEAARVGCVTLQSVRDWVVRFTAQGPAGLINGKAPGRRAILQSVRDWVVRFTAQGPAGLINGKAPGRRAILNETQRAALRAIVEQGPIPAIHGVVRWRLVDLIAWLWEEFRLSISQQTLSRELRAMNYRKLSARPRHYAKNEHAADVFKKRSPTAWRRSQRRSAASR
jgi:transposase